MMYGHGVGWLLMLAVLVAFGVAAALAIISLARAGQGWVAAPGVPRHRHAGDPEDTLRLRYARGDIDTEEFDRRLHVLRDGGHIRPAG
jgi:putative membrane protein